MRGTCELKGHWGQDKLYVRENAHLRLREDPGSSMQQYHVDGLIHLSAESHMVASKTHCSP